MCYRNVDRYIDPCCDTVVDMHGTFCDVEPTQ